MANKIEVNTKTLKTGVEEIETRIQKIQNSTGHLENVLHQLEQMWEGEAKQAFSASVQDDLRRLRELVKAIRDLTDRTGASRIEYEKCENSVSQIVASIKI